MVKLTLFLAEKRGIARGESKKETGLMALLQTVCGFNGQKWAFAAVKSGAHFSAFTFGCSSQTVFRRLHFAARSLQLADCSSVDAHRLPVARFALASAQPSRTVSSLRAHYTHFAAGPSPQLPVLRCARISALSSERSSALCSQALEGQPPTRAQVQGVATQNHQSKPQSRASRAPFHAAGQEMR